MIIPAKRVIKGDT